MGIDNDGNISLLHYPTSKCGRYSRFLHTFPRGHHAVGNNPEGRAFDGANIWVGNQNSNTVTKLRASDGTTLGTFAVGRNPHGVAW
jgi:DNA-binding beta-propeller fold protein YncE